MGTWTTLERWASVCSGVLCCQFPPKPAGVPGKESCTVPSPSSVCDHPGGVCPSGGHPAAASHITCALRIGSSRAPGHRVDAERPKGAPHSLRVTSIGSSCSRCPKAAQTQEQTRPLIIPQVGPSGCVETSRPYTAKRPCRAAGASPALVLSSQKQSPTGPLVPLSKPEAPHTSPLRPGPSSLHNIPHAKMLALTPASQVMSRGLRGPMTWHGSDVTSRWLR